MLRGWAPGASVGFVFAVGGCAPVEALPPVVSEERVVRTERVEVPAPRPTTTADTSNEGELVVETKRVCDVREWNTIERELVQRHENKAPWIDVAFGALGLGMAASGIYALADSANEPGSQTEIAIGTGLVLGGAVLGALTVVDLVRMRQVTSRKEIDRTFGRRVATNVPCRKGGVEGAYVELRLGRVSYLAGTTDPTGRVATKLDTVFGPEVHVPLSSPLAKLVVAGQVEGDVDLRGFAAKREEERWRDVNLQQCAEALTLDACTPVETYLRIYPEGPHANDARRTQERAEPRLRELREQRSWHRVREALATCSGREASEAAAVDVACGVVGGYVREFPKGEHVREAEAAIAAGKARSASLRAAAAKREKDQCAGSCRTYCASASVAHFDDCFKGCIDGRCQRAP